VEQDKKSKLQDDLPPADEPDSAPATERSRIKRRTTTNDDDENDSKKPRTARSRTRSQTRADSLASERGDSGLASTETSITVKKKTSGKNSKTNETTRTSRVDEIDRGSKLIKQIQKQMEPKPNKKVTGHIRERQNKQSAGTNLLSTQPLSSLGATKQSGKTHIPIPVYHPAATIEIDSPPQHQIIINNHHHGPVRSATTAEDDASPSSTTMTTPKPSTFKRIQSLFRHTPQSEGSTRVNRAQIKPPTSVAFGSSTPTTRILHPTAQTPMATTPQTSHQRQFPPKNQTPKNKYNLRSRMFSKELK